MVGDMDERGRLPGATAFAIGVPSSASGRKEKSVSWLLRRKPTAMRPEPKAVSIEAVMLTASPSASTAETCVVPGRSRGASGAYSRPSRKGGSPASAPPTDAPSRGISFARSSM